MVLLIRHELITIALSLIYGINKIAPKSRR